MIFLKSSIQEKASKEGKITENLGSIQTKGND